MKTATKIALLSVPLVCAVFTAMIFVQHRHADTYTVSAALATQAKTLSQTSSPNHAELPPVTQAGLGVATATPAAAASPPPAAAPAGTASPVTTAAPAASQSTPLTTAASVSTASVNTAVPPPLQQPTYQETQRTHPDLLPGVPVVTGNNPADHCLLTKGEWCGPYWTQPPQPTKPPPRHSLPCPQDCLGRGWCDHERGTCWCRAGYAGVDCSLPDKRHCAGMGPNYRDRNYTRGVWIHSRCGGICDDDIGMCHCPPETKFGRKVPSGQPVDDPVLRGRPMFWCQPNTTKDGTPVKWTWNMHTYDDTLGPRGWCNDNVTVRQCACLLDGMTGMWCDQVVEQTCVNQCTGHGDCLLGFCRCHAGWYGHDCSRRKAGLPYEPGQQLTSKPWMLPVVREVPAAADPQLRPFRKRPYIYVYDLHPQYNMHMMQYRLDKNMATNRLFVEGNRPDFVGYNAYSIETVFHELMLTSEHRTYDPSEADYFYVPIHVSNLADVVGKAHRPYWPADVDGTGQWGARAYQMSAMVRDAQKWLAMTYPHWNKSNGADHIWMLSHDEAPCYAPDSIWNSVILSHWGRMDFPHGSNSSYGADDYSLEQVHPSWPGGWKAWSSGAHPCHDPSKHLVVPVFKQPAHYSHSLYLGAPLQHRDILAFFRGDMGLTRHGCKYSRCIRQTLWKLNKKHDWRVRYNIVYGDSKETPGEYTQLLSRSKFCLVIPGDGWSARYEDSMLHGCVPAIIMDNTLGPFESLIDYSKFAIRIGEHELDKLVDILQAVTPERLQQMQQAMAKAWMRFRWNGLPLGERSLAQIMRSHPLNAHPGMEWAQTADDDAFSTVMQWLYHRIPHTRTAPARHAPGMDGPMTVQLPADKLKKLGHPTHVPNIDGLPITYVAPYQPLLAPGSNRGPQHRAPHIQIPVPCAIASQSSAGPARPCWPPAPAHSASGMGARRACTAQDQAASLAMLGRGRRVPQSTAGPRPRARGGRPPAGGPMPPRRSGSRLEACIWHCAQQVCLESRGLPVRPESVAWDLRQ